MAGNVFIVTTVISGVKLALVFLVVVNRIFSANMIIMAMVMVIVFDGVVETKVTDDYLTLVG